MHKNVPHTIPLLLLDFRFGAFEEGTLVTCSQLPLDRPDAIAAAFSETAFLSSASSEIWVDLLRSLEKEFEDWEEGRPHQDRCSKNSGGVADESRIVLVTRIKTISQFHRALELFLGAASALMSVMRTGGQSNRNDL